MIGSDEYWGACPDILFPPQPELERKIYHGYPEYIGNAGAAFEADGRSGGGARERLKSERDCAARERGQCYIDARNRSGKGNRDFGSKGYTPSRYMIDRFQRWARLYAPPFFVLNQHLRATWATPGLNVCCAMGDLVQPVVKAIAERSPGNQVSRKAFYAHIKTEGHWKSDPLCIWIMGRRYVVQGAVKERILDLALTYYLVGLPAASQLVNRVTIARAFEELAPQKRRAAA